MFYNQKQNIKSSIFEGVYIMNPIDQRLYDTYCDPILLRAENFDESHLRKLFDSVNLEESLHNKLLDALLEFHYQWSLDAFAVGLHLGLSLHSSTRPVRRETEAAL